jgi:DamX protein
VITKEKPAFALVDTLAVHGIRKNPFPIDQCDDLFFSTPTLTKQIELLRNLVAFGDLLLVVSGVEGAGKTTFLNQFILAADGHWSCCRIDARAAMSLDSLVDELLRGFGMKAYGDDVQDDETLLRTHLVDLRANGHVAVVTVDDAHLLPQICTEFLLGLAQPREEIQLRLLLCTEPGRLGFSTNDAKRVHVVVLQPFDEQQSSDYINTRLQYAGLDGDSPFSATVIENIRQDSGGLPGTMHSLALHTLMANTDTAQFHRRPLRIPRPVVYLAMALVIAGAAALLLRPDPGYEPVASIDTGATDKIRGRVEGVVTRSSAGEATTGGNKTQTAKAVDTEPQPISESGSAKTAALESKQAPAGVVLVRAADDTKAPSPGLNNASTRPAITLASPGPAKDATPAMVPVSPLAGNVTTSASLPAEPRAARDLDWLHKQEPSNYVIQLVGTRNVAAADKFVDDHKLGPEGAWFLTSHENKPWYVVVYGMYPDSASARAAIKTLPEALRAGSPWPRSVASVVENAR